MVIIIIIIQLVTRQYGDSLQSLAAIKLDKQIHSLCILPLQPSSLRKYSLHYITEISCATLSPPLVCDSGIQSVLRPKICHLHPIISFEVLPLKSLPDSSLSFLIRPGWHQEGQPATNKLFPGIEEEDCLMVNVTGFSWNGGASVTNKLVTINLVGSWLSTLCCWEAAAHTNDYSWKKIDVKMIMMMMMFITKIIYQQW